MKYSRLGRYTCSSCCWPCCFTLFFLLATSVIHVTAETLTTTAAIKYNHREQPKQQQQLLQQQQLNSQSERQERQQLFLQYNQQQSTQKNREIGNNNDDDDNYEDDTAEIISGTILQSAMDIIDDKFDYKNNNNTINNNVYNHRESRNRSRSRSRSRSNAKESNERPTDFPKAKIVKVTSPTMINIETTNSVNDETMKLSTAITPTSISTSDMVMPTAIGTTTVVKIVTETAPTTKMSRTTATTKLLPPIATAYAKIKMSGLEAPEKETNEHDDYADDDEDDDEDDEDEHDEDEHEEDEDDEDDNNSIGRSRRDIFSKSSNGSKNSNNSTMLLYQQQYPTTEQPQRHQLQRVQQEKAQQERQTTSLANVTPPVVLHRGTTPSTLLRLMSEQHGHYASLYAPPHKRGRREEQATDEQVDKCHAFLQSDDNKNVINSPDYPNNYPKNINCTRVIEAKKGQVIRLDFRNEFNIEAREDCKYDYLEIRDGQYGFSDLIGKYCGTDFPPEITSKERFLWLHFHSDDSIEYSGFTAVYEFIDRTRETPSTELNCTIEVSGLEGEIKSDDVPTDIIKQVNETKVPLDCMWRITVNETWRIQIKFEKFELTKPNDCEANFVDIFPEETTIPRRLKNFCGSAGEGVPSDINIMHIRFYAEPSAIGSKFEIHYNAFRERGAAPCPEDQLDCEDSTCIPKPLQCYKPNKCKSNKDEEGCSDKDQPKTNEIVIIIVVFGLILGGMILTFLVNCIRKIMRDQKIIREHIRQSKESKLDELSRHSKGRSRDNISMAMSPRQKHSETSLHILDDVSQRDYYGVAEISVHSNKTLDIRDKEQLQQQHHHQQQKHHQQQQQQHQQHQIERERERERSHEREREHIIMRHDMVVQTSLCEGDTNNDDGDSMATGNDLVTPAATYRSDMGCQTRESLFATALLRQKSVASSEGGSAIIAGRTVNVTPQPHFSTFGYDATSAVVKPKHAATLRHSIRAPLLPTGSIVGSIDSEQLPHSQMAPTHLQESCHHHHRHHIPPEQALEQSQEPRFHTQIFAQAQPLTSHQHQHQHTHTHPYPHQHHHQHQHQYQHQHSHPHQLQQQHQHQQLLMTSQAQAPPPAPPPLTSSLPHQHKTKVIIPPLTPVAPTPLPPTVYSGGNNETSKHTALVSGSTKPQKQKSDDSKGYIDRNSAPDVIIMTSH